MNTTIKDKFFTGLLVFLVLFCGYQYIAYDDCNSIYKDIAHPDVQQKVVAYIMQKECIQLKGMAAISCVLAASGTEFQVSTIKSTKTFGIFSRTCTIETTEAVYTYDEKQNYKAKLKTEIKQHAFSNEFELVHIDADTIE